MSQAVVVMKQDWSITCKDVVQYEGMKALLRQLGYTFDEHDRYESSYSTVCSSDYVEGGVTQAEGEEEHHFDNVMDFMVFHFNLEEEVACRLALLEQQAA